MKNANMKSFIYSLCFTIVTNIQHFKFSDFKLRVDMQGNDSESTPIACCAVCTLCSCEGCQGREGKESQVLNNCRAEELKDTWCKVKAGSTATVTSAAAQKKNKFRVSTFSSQKWLIWRSLGQKSNMWYLQAKKILSFCMNSFPPLWLCVVVIISCVQARIGPKHKLTRMGTLFTERERGYIETSTKLNWEN